MRIGILTLPIHTNYGGILQAYALQTVLERMGHEVCLIDKKHKVVPFPLWKAPLVYGKRIVLNATGHSFPIFYEQKINRERPIESQNTIKFINKYIRYKIVNKFSDIQERDFDAIVVGSDQIWRPKYFYDKIEHAYLDFTAGWNIRRIAYAASFGTDKWEYSLGQTRRCGELLRRFDAVSVRENTGVNLCQKYFGIVVEHLLDPTMLLQKNDYIRLFENNNTPKSKGTLLNYILDETPKKTAIINKVVKEKGLVPFRVNSKLGNPTASLEDRIQPSVESWLRGFYDAEFIVTDSFHACVFSILFNKPFITIGNTKRGLTRFTSLLEMFGLKNRIISDDSDKIIDSEINWNYVNSMLTSWTVSSNTFLRNNLNY